MLLGSYGLNFDPNFAFLMGENDDFIENKNKIANKHYI